MNFKLEKTPGKESWQLPLIQMIKHDFVDLTHRVKQHNLLLRTTKRT